MIVKGDLKTDLKEFVKPEPLIDVLIECIEPLSGHDRKDLEHIVELLTVGGNNQWAVGEMLQRVIHFLGNANGFYKPSTNETDLIEENKRLKKELDELTYVKNDYQRLDKQLRERIGELKSELKDAKADVEYHKRHCKCE